MKIVSVIPLSKGIWRDSLAYFTAQEIPLGSLVSVPVKNRIIDGLVVAEKSVKDLKTQIKKTDFGWRKISRVKKAGYFSPEFIKAANLTADYYATFPGQVIKSLIPQIILDDFERERVTAVTNLNQKNYLEPLCRLSERYGGEKAPFTQTSLFERVPKYVDYLYMNDYINGWNLKTVTDNFDIELGKEYYRYIDPGGKPFQVNGNECVVYLFDLSCIKNKVKRVQAEITVANDYRIQLAEIFTKKTTGGHSAQGENFD